MTHGCVDPLNPQHISRERQDCEGIVEHGHDHAEEQMQQEEPVVLQNLCGTNIRSGAVMQALLDARAQIGTTLIIVTHDVQVASVADRVIKMRDGAPDSSGPS